MLNPARIRQARCSGHHSPKLQADNILSLKPTYKIKRQLFSGEIVEF